MAEENISIIDESGDHKYFTVIPNYILNHSTHWDREVYIQMKRIAGENGTCYAGLTKLRKATGFSKERLNNSIKYLLEHKWITFLGKKEVGTRGGNQLTNEYKINDIWKMNVDFYQKGGSPDCPPINKGGSPNEAKGGRQITKGGSPYDHKEEHIQEEPIKKILAANAADPINQVLEVFYKTINPTINFGNKTQRAAAQNLIDKLGLEKTIKAAKYAVTIQGEQYAPVISTPIALQNKIGDLVSYGKKNNQSKSAVYEPKPTDNG